MYKELEKKGITSHRETGLRQLHKGVFFFFFPSIEGWLRFCQAEMIWVGRGQESTPSNGHVEHD